MESKENIATINNGTSIANKSKLSKEQSDQVLQRFVDGFSSPPPSCTGHPSTTSRTRTSHFLRLTVCRLRRGSSPRRGLAK